MPCIFLATPTSDADIQTTNQNIKKAQHTVVDQCLVNRTLQPFCSCGGLIADKSNRRTLGCFTPYWLLALPKRKTCFTPMVCVLNSGARGPGSSPDQAHCVVFFGKTLHSHSASGHPGV